MPCNAEYMNPTDIELHASRMKALLAEVETGTPVDTDSREWHGYAEGVYGKGRKDIRAIADSLAAELCRKLTAIGDASRYSLELQIWWRDHQRADEKRRLKELRESEG